MKIPMKWLREYVDTDLGARSLSERMVMAGNGVEGIERTGAQFEGVVVGRVLTCEVHPDSDHLHVCTVDVGAAAPLQIVCGAPNARAGLTVAVALEGARLPGGDIRHGKIRGVESFGMLCSGPELDVPEGLYPHIGDKGIMELEDGLTPGTDVKTVFGLGDEVIDFEVLANRPDCLSVWGLAREAAAVLDAHCVMPEIRVEEASGVGAFADWAKVRVLDSELCPRYCARVIKNVRLARSPMWLREYLYGAGVRPINNIVDITNYIMLETGHPMHAFDLAKVRGASIVVRRAHPGETLVTLDGKTHELTDDMLVIADEQRATGLAGIMGGEESEITETTTDVLFECAAFDRTSARLTSRALGIRTESSARFEKGVRAETAMEALERACMLVNELDCGSVVPGACDLYPNPTPAKEIRASVSRVNRLISTNLSGEDMQDILERLSIDTDLHDGQLTCTPPAWRGDLETEADLAEEVLRLYGYDHIPSVLMIGETMAGKRGEKQSRADRLKAVMVAGGFHEIETYSFVSPKWLSALMLPEKDARLDPVRLRNPLGEDTSVMRTSLVPSMLSTVALNLSRGNADARLFELSPVFLKTREGALPEEALTLIAAATGAAEDFYAMKAAVDELLRAFGISAEYRAGGDGYYHPGRKAELFAGDLRLGQMGEAHPDAAGNFEIDARVYLVELSVSAVAEAARPVGATKPLPRFPATARDLALVVDERVEVGSLISAIREAGGELLENVALFDVYRGLQLGLQKKSAAFTLTFRAPDRTLTDAETAQLTDGILKTCADRYGAQIRA